MPRKRRKKTVSVLAKELIRQAKRQKQRAYVVRFNRDGKPKFEYFLEASLADMISKAAEKAIADYQEYGYTEGNPIVVGESKWIN